MPVMSRDAAKRMLMAEAPKVPEHVLEMLLDVHEKNPAYFQEQMREVLRAEKSGGAKAAPRALPAEIPSIIVENPIEAQKAAA